MGGLLIKKMLVEGMYKLKIYTNFYIFDKCTDKIITIAIIKVVTYYNYVCRMENWR